MKTSVLRRATGLAELEEVRGQIQQWRESRTHLCAMPAGLWQAAAELARSQGVSPVAQALRLEYYALKKRVGALAPVAQATATGGPKFLEVTMNQAQHSRDGVVEMERGDGSRLRIEGVDGETILALGRAYLRMAP